MRTVGELAALPHMTLESFGRIAPNVTTFPETSGGFDPANASSLAIRTMKALGGAQEPVAADQGPPDEPSPVLDTSVDDHLFGRTLTIVSVARDANGAQTHRMAIVELTGGKVQPYWIRYVE